jgi:hypothetical protein
MSVSQLTAAGKGFNLAKGPAAQWLQNGTAGYYNAGNVGIGTTTPINNLQIGNLADASSPTPVTLSLGGTYSNTAGSNPKLKIYESASSSFGLGVSAYQLDYMVPVSSRHAWFVNGSEKMRIDPNGNVGIGTTTPSDRLDLGGGNILMGYGMTTGTCSNVWNCVFSCPAGKQVIAGGCYTANNAVAIAQNQPLSTTQWQCGSLNYTATTWAWFLLCANIK